MSSDKANEPVFGDRVPTGIKSLDTILNGGFLRGGIYIVQAPPGAGKTILANQLCFANAASGGKALYVTLLAESHARMFLHMRSLSFFDPSVLPEKLYYISVFQALEDDGLKGLVDILRREVGAQGSSIMILDGFVAAEELAESKTELKKFIHLLQSAAVLNDCTIFLLTSAQGGPVLAEHTMVDGIIEMSDVLLGGWRTERRLEVRKFRGSAYLRGRHAYRITNDGISIIPRVESLSVASLAGPDKAAARLTTGLPRLDEMLDGGLLPGSTTLVAGPPGIGKTTVGLHMLAASSAEAPGLLLSFSEPPQRLLEKSLSMGLGLQALVASGAVELLWQPATEGGLDELGYLIIDNVQRRGVKRVVIDGLAGLEQATAEPGRIRRFCTALAAQMRSMGASSLYTAETDQVVTAAPLESFADSSLQGMSSIADNIVVMRYVKTGSQLHRMVSILKARDSGFQVDEHAFVLSTRGVVIDETAERANLVLARAPGGAGDGSRGDS